MGCGAHTPRVWATALLLGGLWLTGGCAASRGKQPAVRSDFQSEPWSYRGQPGSRITTAHYQIFTTVTDPVLLQAIPQMMETAYAYYRQLVPSAEEPIEPMRVYLFARRSDWADFTRRLAGPRARKLLQVRYGGYCERGVTVIEYTSHATTFPLLGHEGFHQYIYHCAQRPMPAWLNEGLAVLCEGQRWSRKGLAEFDPWYNPPRRNDLAEALLRKQTFSLAELLRIHAGNVVGTTNRRISAYYAQLWALMLFLREGAGGRYAAGFQRLLNGIGAADLEQYAQAAHIWSDTPTYNFGESLFRNFIAEDLSAVQEEYDRFMHERILGRKGR